MSRDLRAGPRSVALASVALAWFAVGCRPAASASPSAEAAAPAAARSVDPDAERSEALACARHVERLKAEYCGDEPDDACSIELACAWQVDFDGDGASDAVRIVGVHDEEIGLRVTFANGREETIGTAPIALTEVGEPRDPGRTQEPGMSWIMAAEPAPRRGPTISAHGRAFAIPQARGGGLWLSGGDAAAILVLAHDGWLLVELGY